MKKIILATFISCLACFGANAQSPATNINAKVEAGRKTNGTVLVHTEEKKFKVYASFKKSKVTDLYAIDMNGNRINPTYSASKGGVTCMICIESPGGTFCYTIDCKDIPPQKNIDIKARI